MKMKLLKSVILTVALLAGAGVARAALDFPSVPTLSPGKNATLTVGAGTTAGTTALQFTMTLPEGIALANTTVTLDKNRATDHTYRLNKVSESSYKCVIYSNSNTPFTGTSGNLFSITLKPASTASKGEYAMNFTEIRSADATGRETLMPDASLKMQLIIPATSVAVDPAMANIYIGDELKLKATVSPAEASQAVVWSSSDETKVTVGNDGTVHGIAIGYAYVTATTTDGTNRSARCRVNVSKIDVAQVTLNSTSLELHLGDTGRLVASVKPDNATNRSVNWKSSNTSVVTVDSEGNLTPKAEGTATVTVTSADNSSISASCQVRVLKALIKSVAFDRSSLALRVRDTATLKATVTPAASAANVAWSSSNTAVATVSSTGIITAVAPGNAVITLATTDGTGLKAECAVTVSPALVSSVTLDRTQCTLYPGNTANLRATVAPDYAANRTLAWSSSNEAVATVDNTGHVVAVGLGNAVITASATDGSGKSATCAVEVVNAPSSGVIVDPSELTMRTTETALLRATVLPATAAQDVRWSSSAPDVASVDADGRVTALKAGVAVISATTTDSKAMSGECRVTVLPPLAVSVTLSQTNLWLRVRDTAALIATVNPSDAPQTLEWRSSDPAVATVDANGMVSALAPGTAVISASTTDGSGVYAECDITVAPALVTSVTLDRGQVDLLLGESTKLNATVLPDYAGNRTVEWRSTDGKIASVDQDGTVTAVGVGSAEIIAVATDGTGISASCKVSVTAPLAESITLDYDRLEIEEEHTAQLTATVLPAQAEQTVRFSSSDSSVASVDETGMVTAVSPGTAVIIATTTDGTALTAVCMVTVKEHSGIAGVSAESVAVCAIGNEIIVKGIADNVEIKVTDASGAVVYSGFEHRIGGLAAGFHIVVIGPQAYKVMLR